MKTGILSMQMVNNYGSLLQAYALKKIIESLGSKVEFIDIKKIDSDYNMLGEARDYFRDESNTKSSLLRIIFDKDLPRRFTNKITKQQFVKKCNEFRTEFLDIEIKSSNYDLAIIGSDEVFNCLQRAAWGYTSQLYGNIPEASKIITYAASCGSTRYENVPSNVRDSIKNSMNNISGFSARDNNTYDFIKKFGFNNVNINLDPVLIYDFFNELERATLPKLPQHYCIIYSYPYRFCKKGEIDEILAFCKRHGLTPLAIQAGQTWCKNYIACSPFECLKVFENANFVITDTFHGAIFSAKYAERFAVISRPSNNNKLGDLIKRIDLSKHFVSDISDIEDVYKVKHDKDGFNKIIENERNATFDYLNKYIE